MLPTFKMCTLYHIVASNASHIVASNANHIVASNASHRSVSVTSCYRTTGLGNELINT